MLSKLFSKEADGRRQAIGQFCEEAARYFASAESTDETVLAFAVFLRKYRGSVSVQINK